ncbi:MAG: NAD(P)H-binding protein [Deltaproteobacteria bacterium]|nr:NAD(P)H-binding protein [Deltaproteobacteria bacterium]
MSGGRRRVAIAGATGFVGRALAAELVSSCDVVGITRGDHVRRTASEGALEEVEWRRSDLFSLLECELALAGCTHAYYLVHSMMPSARLTQASFDDLDLLLADNFARAARRAGIERIVYLGGILPAGEVSDHLRSRHEVEDVLASTGVPVTTVRAGLVLGPGGSSADMMMRLVQRLPVMACPSWTRTESSPIDVRDLLPVLVDALTDPRAPLVIEVGGPEVVSYRALMQRTGQVLGKRRWFVPVPLFTPGLSTLWVSLVTGASRALVRPLVQSLRHSMLPTDLRWQRARHPPVVGLEDSLRHAITAPRSARVESMATVLVRDREARPRNTVRSVQRLPNPGALTAREVATEYLRWLPRFLRPLVRVEVDGELASFGLAGLGAPLLVLRQSVERSEESRPLFYVVGGLLARPDLSPLARLEFRQALGGSVVVAAIHDFVPRLPWFAYNATQALVHLWVMRSFGRHLGRQSTTKRAD